MPELKVGVCDSTCWLGSGLGVFMVSQAYEWWTVGHNQELELLDYAWNSSTLYLVQCFCWLVVLDRVKTAEFLLKIGMIPDANKGWCYFCRAELESSNHLLLHCGRV